MTGRLPVVWRLTIAFAVATAIILVAGGLLLRQSLYRELDRSVSTSLQLRAETVAASPSRTSAAAVGEEPDERVTQLLDPSGRVLAGPPPFHTTSVLDAATLERATRGPVEIESSTLPGTDERMRLLARPAGPFAPPGAVLVVGETLEDRDEAVASLTTILLLAGPFVLLLISALGYAVARAALRPVDLALARERAFTSTASHELRTPLAILRAEVDLAVEHGRSREELEEALVSVGEEVDRLSRLADDLLLLARLDGGGALRRERLTADVLLAGAAERIEPRAAAAGRAVVVSADSGVTFDADRPRLEQALGNLAENALRHGAGTITLYARRTGDRVELGVADEGRGFDPAFAVRAFDRFARDGTTGGAGLGLAIVRATAQAHGGDASLSADASGRTAVRIVLPAGRPPTPVPAATP